MKQSPLTERIMNVLKTDKKVPQKDILKAEKLQKDEKIKFTEAIVKIQLMTDEEVMAITSEAYQVPFLRLSKFRMNKDIAKLLPEKIARKYHCLPLSQIGDHLMLVMEDPVNTYALDDIKFLMKRKFSVALGSPKEITETIDEIYRGDNIVGDMVESMDSDEEEIGIVENESAGGATDVDALSSTPVVKLVDLILIEAYKKRASDIHIEPFEGLIRVRYRVDGELIEALSVPKKHQNALTARIKILSAMDITENRIPQDGRFKVRFSGKQIDYRVSVLPVYWGSKIVLRALDKSNLLSDLNRMGLSPQSLNNFKLAISQPFGMIVITGPTGSGKSTTLYSLLSELNTIERNIITVEDPVEYQLDGITQIQARPDIGLTFASGLRAILRQSPDVVMLGEIRDFETADIAIKASLTGQIVLSTLHTNDAAGAITRLQDMGVEPFLISASLLLVAAQRLMRRICPRCRHEIKVPQELMRRLELNAKEKEMFQVKVVRTGKGCEFCHQTGYRGRVAIAETLFIDDHVRGLIEKGASLGEIKAEITARGMENLRYDALTKCAEGITTLEEVLRVTSEDD